MGSDFNSPILKLASLHNLISGISVMVLAFGISFIVPSTVLEVARSAIFLLLLKTAFPLSKLKKLKIQREKTSATSGSLPIRRIRSGSSLEGRLLDQLNVGYFLCRRGELHKSNQFGVVYSNKKGQNMVKLFENTFDSIVENLVCMNDSTKTLREAILESYNSEFGNSEPMKFKLGNMSREKKPRTNSDNSLSQSPKRKKTTVLFNHYTAQIHTLSKSDRLLILYEWKNKKSLDVLEGIKSAITCTISHELRTLSNGIIGSSELVETLGELSPLQRTPLQASLCSSYLLSNKLNDLFDYIQLQNKGFKLHTTEFDIKKMISNINRKLIWLASEHQLTLNIKSSPEVPEKLIGDPERIEQILVNLLNKSIQFTKQGSISLFVSRRKDGKVCFKVTSYGSSMEDVMAQQIRYLSPGSDTSEEETKKEDEAIHNLEALSLQISQILCRQMGSALIGKVVSGRYSQLKFSIDNRFPASEMGSKVSKLIYTNTVRHLQLATPILSHSKEKRNSLARVGSINEDCASPPIQKMDDFADFLEESENKKQRNIFSFFSEDIPNELRTTSPIFIPHLNYHNLMKKCSRANTLYPVVSPWKLSTAGNMTPEVLNRSKEKNIKHSHTVVEIQHCMKKTVSDGDAIVPRGRFSGETNSKPKVLIVDDDATNMYVLRAMLRHQGFATLEAWNGKEAVDVIFNFLKSEDFLNIKLIFMDLQMPIMNGIQATREIYSLCKSSNIEPPPVIGVSADPSESDREKFLGAGIKEFVFKPVNKAKLENIIVKYVH